MSALSRLELSTNTATAQKWTSAGLNVFPCCPTTKRPKVIGWRDVAKGVAWIGQWNQRPGDMPGLDCAYVGIVVIDCDRRDDRDGEAEFVTICEQLGVDLTGVPCVTTPSGGRHYYFRAPVGERIKNSAGQLACGVDVRGEGGFVVVPGARRDDGREYLAHQPASLDAFIRLIAERKLPTIPEPLLRIIGMKKDAGANVVTLPSVAATNELSATIKQRWDLADACARVALAPLGTRNDTLNREAFIAGLRTADGAVDAAEACQKLANAARQAGLTDDEIVDTIDYAFLRAEAAARKEPGRSHGVGAHRSSTRTFGAASWERTAANGLKRSFQNAILAVQALGIHAGRDTFSDKIYLRNAPASQALPDDHVGALTENAISWIRKRCQDSYGFDPGKENLVDAIKALAEEARHDPVQAWLDQLNWDKRRRLRSWLPRIIGAPDTPLFRSAGVLLLLAMVLRLRFPGSKFDLCMVLEGKQGCGKSSLVRMIAAGPGDGYFADAPGLIAMDNKTRAELLAGKWLVELAELSGMAKSETEGVKAFLSQNSDQYRPPYAAVAVERPRRCVFVATTNALTYLPDATGNRRFIPVPCGEIDLAAVAAERDQLFAEADAVLTRLTRQAVKSGHARPGHALPHDLASKFTLPRTLWGEAQKLADQRRVLDPVEEALATVVEALEIGSNRLPDGRRFISSASLLSSLRSTLNCQVRNNGLAGWMAELGWTSLKASIAGKQVRGYAK